MATVGLYPDVPAQGPARLPLLATKLHVPLARTNVVPRPRLLDILSASFEYRLVLVVHKLAHIHQVMGRLLESYQLYLETLAHLQGQGKEAFFAAGYLYCGLSQLQYEWN